MYYVYILECRGGTLYVGSTNDIDKRVAAHNAGKGAKYTRGRTPVVLRYSESFETKGEALKREAVLKRLSRKDKLLLTRGSELWQSTLVHKAKSLVLPRSTTGLTK
jgi:putative endonuclease